MLKKYSLIFSILFSLVPSVITAEPNTMNSIPKVNLLALLPFTGHSGDQGVWLQRGLELAADEWRKKGLIDINISYEETGGATVAAVNAYRNKMLQHRYPLVFTWGSGVGIALTSLVNHDRIVQVGLATGSADYSTPDDYTFRVFPNAFQEGSSIAQIIRENLSVTKILIVHIQNDYGESLATQFSESFKKLGGKIISRNSYLPGESEFRSLITQLRTTQPEYVFLISYPAEAGAFLKQAKQQGVNWQFILSSAATGGSNFFNLAGDVAEGLFVPSLCPDYQNSSSNPELAKLMQIYSQKYNDRFDVSRYYIPIAYSAMSLLAPILRDCEEDTECIRGHLYQMPPKETPIGSLSFDRNGDVQGITYNLHQYRNGRFEIVK